MLPNRETRFCSYRYDPLDRLVDCTPSAQAPTRRFYLKDRLATEIQDAVQRSIMQHDDQLLAQQQRQSGAVETRLLATDQQRSVLNVLHVARPHPLAYSPYGHRPAESGLLSLLGFNGERPDPVTGCYLLGNGYRAFNPVLMRLNSPDSWSPFGEGGLNAYAYCVGNPVNFTDKSGHVISKILQFMDEMITTTTQAITRGKVPTKSMPIERQYLDRIITRHSNPEPYVETLRAVNKNLGSHNNNSLTMPQVKTLESVVKKINDGKISNTTAHLQEAKSWAEKFVEKPNGANFSGMFLNILAAGVRGGVDKNMRTTGVNLRRGSTATPR
jgi:RHS repeat-associated protein